MDTTSSLSQNDESAGPLRRAGRAVLGSAAILIVGAGAAPAAQAASAGSGGEHGATAHHSTSATGPTTLPRASRTPAARFVVGEDGRLTSFDLIGSFEVGTRRRVIHIARHTAGSV